MSLPKVVRPGWCLSVFLKVGGIFVKEMGLFLVCFVFSCKGEGEILIVLLGIEKICKCLLHM